VSRDALFLEGVDHLLVALPRPGRHVRGPVHVAGADLLGELGDLALGPALADHEPGTALAQGVVELTQAAEHERSA